MSNEKCFQSVFDDNTKFEKEMDVIFDADEDFDAFDVTCGLKEDGSVNLPDAEELHQTEHDGVTPDDLRDELGEGHDTDNKPTADSNGEFDIEDDELDLACPKTGVQDAVEAKPTVDPFSKVSLWTSFTLNNHVESFTCSTSKKSPSTGTIVFGNI